MNRTMKLITVSALAALVAIGTGCIIEDTGVEIVLKDTYCMTFEESHQSATFVTPKTIDLAEKLDEALADNDLEREDVVRGAMIVATYEVTDPPSHDWTLTGAITVERTDIVDGPETVIDYASQSLMDAYGAPVFADLNEDGVESHQRCHRRLHRGPEPRAALQGREQRLLSDPDVGEPARLRLGSVRVLLRGGRRDPGGAGPVPGLRLAAARPHGSTKRPGPQWPRALRIDGPSSSSCRRRPRRSGGRARRRRRAASLARARPRSRRGEGRTCCPRSSCRTGAPRALPA